MELDTTEIDQGGISYTEKTVNVMQSRYPGDKLYFLIGTDSLRELWTWRNIKAIASQVTFIALTREGSDPNPHYPELQQKLGDTVLQLILLPAPSYKISSTVIRKKLAQGTPVDDFIPAKVGAYIQKLGLYSGL